jgi:microcompartment protein CcmK/EutM
MRIARVVGNVVSTIKEETHCSYKLMIIEYLDQNGKAVGVRQIVVDAANAGIGDIVLINVDGG